MERMRSWLAGARRALRAVRQGEAGVGMVELLVATGIGVSIVGAGMLVLDSAMRQQPRVSSHAQRVQEARSTLERMTRELRQTIAVNESTSSYIDFNAYSRTGGAPSAVQRRIVYDCTANACTRRDGAVGGELGGAVTVLDGVENVDVFTFSPSNTNPQYLRIKLVYDVKANPTDAREPVTMNAGVGLRNTVFPVEEGA